MEPIEEEPPEFEEQEEILQPEIILRHEDNLLRSGKTLIQYSVKFKNYPPKDAIDMLNEYKFLYELE